MERKLTISFGGGNLAAITDVKSLTWAEFAAMLTATPPETDDKASVGWYSCASFSPVYRDGENLMHRECLTLDYDVITPSDVTVIQKAFEFYEYAIYTTWSHSAEKPRVRVILPLSRPATAEEFCAVSRMVASFAGIELASRESHVPAQCMFMPSRKPGALFRGRVHGGRWVDIDSLLYEQYKDWTDRSEWPHRAEGDSTHHGALAELPDEKAGIVGDFCRAFDIPAAIEKFQLPYVATTTPDRLTYTHGSRPEGAILYDDGRKLHSHHDTDPARGQHNAFDLVRLHKFGQLDAGTEDGVAITDRPSFRAMVTFALGRPEVRACQAAAEFTDLGPLPVEATAPGAVGMAGAVSLARRICDVLRSPTIPRWLLTDVIEHGVIAVMAGPRGSYKSFIALDWSMRIAQRGDCVYVVSAEGGDFDRRAKAWIRVHGSGDDSLPLYVVERRIDLSTTEGIESIRQDCLRLAIRPKLFVLDTFSKLSGGLDENDNTAIKAFIGRLDNGLKRAETGFDATVLLVAHTGHSDAGRPRGASALAADTDAEYIVARSPEGSVSVTRERFKSSPELAPLALQPDVVRLGYHDANGTEITSLVLKPLERAPVIKRKADAEPKNGNQKYVLNRVRQILKAGPRDRLSLVTQIADERPKPLERKDDRKASTDKALTELITDGLLHLKDEKVYLTEPPNATEVPPDEFDRQLEST
jgi:hypothetical protein